jgi:hypothetical protein
MIEQQIDPVHSFNVEDAITYGSIEKALIIKEIRGMQVYKLRNGGQGWVYYSGAALSAKFPYVKQRSIERYMQELVDAGHLECEVRNQAAYDRTKSYRLPELTAETVRQNGESTRQTDESVRQNGGSTRQNGEPIPSPTTSPTTSLNREKPKKELPLASDATRARIRRQLANKGLVRPQPKVDIVRHNKVKALRGERPNVPTLADKPVKSPGNGQKRGIERQATITQLAGSLIT